MQTDKPKLTLAIETSCDETAVAVTRGWEVLSNVVFSQVDLHKKYGGVVPNIAKLEHEKKFPEVLEEALGQAKVKLTDVEQVAVTRGPGLAIALEVGIKKAKELATELNVPLLAVNHMYGHLVSCFAEDKAKNIKQKTKTNPLFPSIGLLVSGGHTEFLLVKSLTEVEKIGQTLDDACGEAYDKFATMLGLEYPGGPVVSKLAAEGRGEGIEIVVSNEQGSLYVKTKNIKHKTKIEGLKLPVPMVYSGDLNVSYSGLKTAVKRMINELSGSSKLADIRQTGQDVNISEQDKRLLCVLFEEAALQMLRLKLEQALKLHPEVREVWVGGGVVANNYLIQLLSQVSVSSDVLLRTPASKAYIGDNAAMIGVAAFAALIDEIPSFTQVSAGRPGQALELVQTFTLGELDGLDRAPGLSL